MFQTVLQSISYNQKGDIFATCGDVCHLWEESRSEPIRTLSWDTDSLHYVAFNPVETFLLGKLSFIIIFFIVYYNRVHIIQIANYLDKFKRDKSVQYRFL